jgi:CheY-like chemotaxis protein
MSNANVHAVLLDDNAGESVSLATLLRSDELQVEVQAPDATVEATAERVASSLPTNEPAVVLLDYRLDDRADVEFRGGSVASAIKERRPELPVVLFTTDEKLHRWVETSPGIEDIFDWRLLKGQVVNNGEAAAHVISLARGWAELAQAASDSADPWDILAGVVHVERPMLETFAEVEVQPPRPEVPGALALWLLRGPLRWPGPLSGPGDTRVMVGVDDDGFRREKVQQWLYQARYRGPFQEFGERWWSEIVRNQIKTLTPDRPADANQRTQALAAELRDSLRAESCVWCGEGRTIRACDLCERAVDAAHSLRRLTAPPPPWADPPVVCFRCVADGSAEDVRFAPGNESVINGLKSGSIHSPLNR